MAGQAFLSASRRKDGDHTGVAASAAEAEEAEEEAEAMVSECDE